MFSMLPLGIRSFTSSSVSSPSFVGVSSFADSNTTSATATVPSGKTSGDVLIAHVHSTGSGATITAPSSEGWSELVYSENGTGNNSNAKAFIKRWGAGFTDNTSVTFTTSVGSCSLVISVFRGAARVSVAPDSTNGANGSASSTFTAPSVTVNQSSSTVVRLYGCTGPSVNISSTAEGSNMYSGVSYSTTTGVDRALAGSYLTGVSAGTTGTANATATTSSTWTALTIVLDADRSAWSPFTPGNLVALYRAGNGIKTSSSNLVYWCDQSGNGNELNTIGSVPPTYGTTNWNSAKPGVNFVGGNNCYALTTSGNVTTFLNSSQAVTVFITCKATSNSNYRVFGSFDTTSSAEVLQFFIDVSKKLAIGSQLSNEISTVDTVDGSNVVISYMMGGGTASAYKDGNTELNGVSFPGYTYTGINRFVVGTNYTGSTSFDGTIAEIAVYSSKLTTTDRDNYRSYATATWGGV